MQQHPFERMERHHRLGAFLITGIGTVVVGTWLWQLGRPLQTPGVPRGIVSLELAWNPARAARIMDEWGETGRQAAVRQTWVDFLFLLFYGSLGSLAVLLTGEWALRSGKGGLAGPARALAWGVGAAAACDAVENAALLRILGPAPGGAQVWVISSAATMKFLLLGAGTVYLAAVAVALVSSSDS